VHGVSLRAAQKQMTRNLLLEQGLKTFGEKGYVAATVDDIVTGAGANRATFYLHFSSKAALVSALIEQISDVVVSSDTPRLPQVVASGDPEQLRGWVGRRMDQWPAIMPYVLVANQAADVEPDIQTAVDRWHESAIAEMHEGLDLADRFDAGERHARAVAAFAQIEYYSRYWAHHGWSDTLPRDAALDVLAHSLGALLH
jgi:AcrR family transcriptional regulator